MNSDWNRHGGREPTPEEIERAIRRGERLRAQALRDIARAAVQGLVRTFGRRAVAPAPINGAAQHAHPV